jgi:hypothetical protein
LSAPRKISSQGRKKKKKQQECGNKSIHPHLWDLKEKIPIKLMKKKELWKLKLFHHAKISSFKNLHIKIDRPIIYLFITY